MRRRRWGEKEQWTMCGCYSCGENFASEKVAQKIEHPNVTERNDARYVLRSECPGEELLSLPYR